MNRELAEVGGRIDAVFFCPHGPDDGCACRKPLPGLFTMIGERYGVSLRETYAVGDSLRDLQAGVAAGCAPHLVRTGKGAALDTRGAARARQGSAARHHPPRPRRLRAAADPARAPSARRRRRGRLRLRQAAVMARALAVVPLGAVRPLPDGDGRAVGDRRPGLFDLRPRRAAVLVLRRLAGPVDLGGAGDLRRARPRPGAREPARQRGRSSCPSTSRPGRPSPSRP